MAAPRPLGNIARAFAAMGGNLYKPPQNTIDSVSVQAWPSALQPVQPTGPKGSQPLAFSYWNGLNLEITPRADSALTFADLRALATYPLARICIENVKDILCTVPWKIQRKRAIGQAIQEWKESQKTDKNIPMLTDFFAYPDGETPWADFWRPVIDDMLVVDAASVLVQRNLGGKVVKLRWSDGTQFLRLIDDQGFAPQAPNPAFTQLWEGIPRLLLSTRQLLYRPSNIVAGNSYSSKIYGNSITQQMAEEIAIGQERLNFVLAFYKNGVTGGMIQVIPAGVLPDKVTENLQWFNNFVAGNLGKRRNLNILQGYHDVTSGREDQIIQLKEPVMADAFDDLHIKKMAFAYGVSAQRLMKQMNRASAEAGQDAAEKEGIMPRLKWFKGTIDLIIQRQMDLADYEVIFDTDDELDAVKQSAVDKSNSGAGLRTIDEIREDRGLVPFGLPETSQPIIVTATGVQPLEGSFDRVNQQMDNDTATANKPTPKPVAVPTKKVASDWYAARY